MTERFIDFVSYELTAVIFNLTFTGSLVILFVLLARLALKKAPKKFSYALWAVVLFRLLCPVSISADFSLLGLLNAPVTQSEGMSSTVEYIPQHIVHVEFPQVDLPLETVEQAINENLPYGEEQLVADPLEAPFALSSLVWMTGAACMLIYSAVSFFLLRRRLVGALPLRDNIFVADDIASPFVMGLFWPKIYLPSTLAESEREYIILHEQYHIRRMDHMVKILAFAALCVHWFNPLVWLAFMLSGKDMEMSCDEAVMKKLGEGIRADYSASLLALATGRRIISGTPLAFGEGNTGGRIKNLLSWKKPALWVTVTAVILCAAVIIACAVNPDGEAEENIFGKTYKASELVYDAPMYSFLYDLSGSPWYQVDEDMYLHILEDLDSDNWLHPGVFEETELTTRNFVNYFRADTAGLGWTDGFSAVRLCHNNQKAWRLCVDKTLTDSVFYYLLLQKNGEVYLTYGYYDPEGETDPMSDDSSIRWVFRLTDAADPVFDAFAQADSPWQWARNVSVSDVTLAQLSDWSGETATHMNLSAGELERVVGILNHVANGSVYTGRGIPSEKSLMLSCGGREYLLRYGGGVVELTFDSETAKLYGDGIWMIDDEALNLFFENFSAETEPEQPTGSQTLTQQEIDAFNESFVPVLEDEAGNRSVNPISCFFTSYYDSVQKLDLEAFLKHFPGGCDVTSEVEFQALKEHELWLFGEEATLENMPVPVHKKPVSEINEVLQAYAGITLEDILDNRSGLYLEEYEAYYNFTSDFAAGVFKCTRGERDGDIIRLYSENANWASVLTLREENGKYLIVSHQRLK